jgi:hypothetical protein
MGACAYRVSTSGRLSGKSSLNFYFDAVEAQRTAETPRLFLNED